MTKILFLAGAYHPHYSANGLCVKNVVDACVAAGIEVTCVVNDAAGCKKTERIDGAMVKRVKPRLIIRWQQWRQGRGDGKALRVLDALATGLNRTKMLVMSGTWPLVAPLYTYRFFKAGKRVLAEGGYDAMVAVYTPIDSLLAGYLLKKKFPEVAFVPYYLDALAGGWGPSRWALEKTERHTKRWEVLVDIAADVIVSMSSAKGYHESHPISAGVQDKRAYLDVPLMTKAMLERAAQTSAASEGSYALFAGNIPFPRRDPRPTLELMSRVCAQCGMDFIVAGECSDPSVFDEYVEKSGGRVKPIGQQPKERIDELEAGAAVLVNIGSQNPNTIPGKIFEYMGHLKPIISTYAIDDEPSRTYLAEYGHAVFVDESRVADPDTAEDVVAFVRKYRQITVPRDACAEKFYKNRPEAFVDLLMEKAVNDAGD